MKAIVYEGPGEIEVKDVEKPEPREGWTRIRVSHAGICGSDMTIFAGKHPRAKAPLVLGHEFSGVIDSPHPTLKEGTLVTVYPYLPCGVCERCANGQFHVCKSLKLIGIDQDGGMAQYVLVPQDCIYRVDADVAPEMAAFIEPVGISVHVARHGKYRPGDSVMVVGAGGIGLSTAITLRAFGAQNVIISEPNPIRQALARELGFDVLAGDKDVVEQVYARTNGDGVEHVFDCAGVQGVVDFLPDVVKINGNVVIVAGYKTPPAMDFQKGMFREFTVRFVRNCTREDFAIARNLVGQDLGYDRILNYMIPLEEAQAGFHPPQSAYKVIFKVD